MIQVESSNRIDDIYQNTDDYNPKNFNCVWWHDCRRIKNFEQ